MTTNAWLIVIAFLLLVNVAAVIQLNDNFRRWANADIRARGLKERK